VGEERSGLTESEVSQSLVERILQKDRTAEAEMVQRYQRGLYVMLFNRAKNKALAEDIAQESLTLVLTKVRNNDLRDPTKLAAYIIQIGKNQLLMHYRQQSKFDIIDDADLDSITHGQAAHTTPEQAAINEQLGELIQEVLSELKQTRDQDIIKGFYLSGKTKQDLCDVHKVTPAHFDRVLYRARERFKKLWTCVSQEKL